MSRTPLLLVVLGIGGFQDVRADRGSSGEARMAPDSPTIGPFARLTYLKAASSDLGDEFGPSVAVSAGLPGNTGSPATT